MRDSPLEEQLRRALHAEADAIPFRIASARIYRQLSGDRRLLMTRALAGVAAAFVLAAAGVLVLATRPTAPPVASSPTPTPVVSPTPVTSPSASPTSSASSERPFIGSADEAIVYLIEGTNEDAPQPDISLFAAAPDGSLRTLGSIKGATLPKDVLVSRSDLPGGAVLVSEHGYVAVRFGSGGDTLGATSGVAVYDLMDLTKAPVIVDNAVWMAWGPNDRLAVFSQVNEPFSETLTIFAAATGSKITVPLPAGIAVDHGWSADGQGLVARRDFGADLLEYEVGVLRLDGTFQKSASLPPLDQRTGLERPYGTGGRRADIACDSSGQLAPGLTGCWVVVRSPDGAVRQWRTGRVDRKLPPRVDWNARGTALWGVVDPWPDKSAALRQVEVLLLTGVERSTRVSTVRAQNPNEALIVGFAGGDREALVLNGGDKGGNLVRIDTSSGKTTVVGGTQRLDGFAGWGTAQDSYPGR
jgi:hypothetical protein